MKYYTVPTRDFSKTIQMGALVVRNTTGKETEIAPARTEVLEEKQGKIAVWHRKKDMAAYLVAINVENPGAVVECDVEGRY